MSKLNYVQGLVEHFVAAVNAGQRSPLGKRDVTDTVIVRTATRDVYEWSIVPCRMEGLIADLEAETGMRFPGSYRSLITRFAFPRFDAGGLLFLGNTPEGLPIRCDELRFHSGCDEGLCCVLRKANLVQFANPSDGSYDPVCFDMKSHGRRNERVIVRINHESALVHGKAEVVAEIAKSFVEFMERVVVERPPG